LFLHFAERWCYNPTEVVPSAAAIRGETAKGTIAVAAVIIACVEAASIDI
jgi:hypothetical protein